MVLDVIGACCDDIHVVLPLHNCSHNCKTDCHHHKMNCSINHGQIIVRTWKMCCWIIILVVPKPEECPWHHKKQRAHYITSKRQKEQPALTDPKLIIWCDWCTSGPTMVSVHLVTWKPHDKQRTSQFEVSVCHDNQHLHKHSNFDEQHANKHSWGLNIWKYEKENYKLRGKNIWFSTHHHNREIHILPINSIQWLMTPLNLTGVLRNVNNSSNLSQMINTTCKNNEHIT